MYGPSCLQSTQTGRAMKLKKRIITIMNWGNKAVSLQAKFYRIVGA